ncbi:MAG: trimethylamine methyltransferase family protein [Anaerolineales bacterium]|nr:trimethylamine methyltransferase family protein [Chloroflexota bacterium]MBL6980057.1 trimethylamine methyltransferase family protein [Anaerolineales bacterium]
MVTKTPDIIPFVSPIKAEVLTQAELETLKAKTLLLLNDVGVHFPSSKALDIFAEHGAQVDRESEIVRLQPELVEKAMASAPRSFILGGRKERFDLFLDGKRSYLCTDGTGVHVIDLETRAKRESCKDDVAMMARVCDALPLVSFFWPMVSSKEYGRTAPLHNCHAGLINTLKHVRGGTTVHPRLAPYIVEMASVVAGNTENRIKRPPICANICTISPLSHDKHGIEAALVYAEAGIPISFMAMPTMGSTAPATPLAALIMGDAEVISAMVLIQLAFPGAPVFHAVFTSLMDPRSGGYISEVPTPSYIMAKQLAHAWNLPCLGGARVSGDAPELGWQSGYEVGLGAGMIAMAGGDICGLMGLVGSATTLYPEEVILDHDSIFHVYEMINNKRFDEIDLALDLIRDVGPRSHFLAQKHTRTHIRNFRLPTLLRNRGEEGQQRDPREIALEKFKHIEATHHPQPLPDDVIAELDHILEAAEIEAEAIFGE